MLQKVEAKYNHTTNIFSQLIDWLYKINICRKIDMNLKDVSYTIIESTTIKLRIQIIVSRVFMFIVSTLVEHQSSQNYPSQ